MRRVWDSPNGMALPHYARSFDQALHRVSAVGFLACLLVLGWIGWGHACSRDEDGGTTGAFSNGKLDVVEGSSGSLLSARAPRVHRLDRCWHTIISVLERAYLESSTKLVPPASEEAIILAERVVGFQFPPEIRWLLSKHNGQQGDSAAIFYNGQRLLSAVEIANTYEMQQAIMNDIDPARDTSRRPSLGEVVPWWPGLLPFATDGGGDCLFVDAYTSRVYEDFEGSVSSENTASEGIAPRFDVWLEDYGRRLQRGDYALHPRTGPISLPFGAPGS